MKIKFRDVRLSKSNKEKLELVNSIIEEYQEQGYVLTLRQLYYQLVSRDVIEMYEESRRIEWVKENFEVIPIALNKKQVEQYDLPPNPAKTTDPRSKEFIATHGNESWEVDALNPSILNALLENSIKSFIDLELYDDILLREETDKERLKEVLDSM